MNFPALFPRRLNKRINRVPSPALAFAATGMLLAGIVAMTVFAGPVMRFADATAQQLHDSPAYIDAVLAMPIASTPSSAKADTAGRGLAPRPALPQSGIFDLPISQISGFYRKFLKIFFGPLIKVLAPDILDVSSFLFSSSFLTEQTRRSPRMHISSLGDQRRI